MSEFPGVSITLNIPGGHMTVRAETPAQLLTQLDELQCGLAFALSRHIEVTSLDTPTAAAQTAPAPRPIRQPESPPQGEVCPTHGSAKTSQYGGLYCPAPDDDAPKGFCTWTSGKQRRGKAG